jgi:wobble nucleotide-excising tRNase
MHVPDRLARGRSSYLTHEFTLYLSRAAGETACDVEARIARLNALEAEALEAYRTKAPASTWRYEMVMHGQFSATVVATLDGIHRKNVAKSVDRARLHVQTFIRDRLESERSTPEVRSARTS